MPFQRLLNNFNMETDIETEDVPKAAIRSKILFIVFGLAVILSGSASFYRYIVARDYIIEAQVDCDPATEACFVTECDPESTDAETMCTGAPTEDTSFYKIIRKNAMNIPACDSSQEECAPLACAEDERDCEYTFCEEGNADGVRCSTAEDAVAQVVPVDGALESVDAEGSGESLFIGEGAADELDFSGGSE